MAAGLVQSSQQGFDAPPPMPNYSVYQPGQDSGYPVLQAGVNMNQVDQYGMMPPPMMQ